MNVYNRSAMARARTMIEIVRASTELDSTVINKAMADGYIAALADAGLINRSQFEDLRIQAELALSARLIQDHCEQPQ
jgi:hypothetical protein